LRELPDDRFYEHCVQAFARAGVNTDQFPLDYVKAALDTCKGKLKTFAEVSSYAGFYFRDEVTLDAEAAKKDLVPENHPRLLKLREAFAAADPFDFVTLEKALKTVAAELGAKAGVLVHPTRLACTGATSGPSLYHLLAVLGKDRVLARIDKALAVMK